MPAQAPRVMVVDDDPFVRDLAKLFLEQSGCDAVYVADGETALAFLAMAPVDIVFLDILMPRRDGVETLIALKRRFPETAVYAMSGDRKGHDFLKIAKDFGADGVLQKPFPPEQLLAIITEHSARKSAGTGS